MTDGPTEAELLAESALSLDAPAELAPFLLDLFADLSDLGVRSADVVRLLAEAEEQSGLVFPDRLRHLDLGCGKGAVVRALAAHHTAVAVGVDAHPGFIALAAQDAPSSCRFVCDDIHAFVAETIEKSLAPVSSEAGNADASVLFDLVTFFAMGEVFGEIDQTVATLRACTVDGGFVALDDAVCSSEDLSLAPDERLWSTAEAEAAFEDMGVEVVHHICTETTSNREWLAAATASLVAKAEVLAAKNPAQADALVAFAERQREEIEAMAEAPVEGVLWLLRV